MFRSSNIIGSKLRRIVSFGSIGLLSTALAALVACNGNTGGERDDANAGDPFVSDGGAGGSLKIVLNDDTIGVGEVIGYRVVLKDSTGQGIPFIRIFCETEKGLAIVEPSSGGVAFESTDANGEFSGKLGGVTPGSFLMECRAQQGFNLYDRVTVIVGGDVPLGFQGFPGAAGGNLGGGVIIDQTPGTDDGVGLRITSMTFSDAGGSDSLGPLDLAQELDCDGSTSSSDPEQFTYTSFNVGIANSTEQTVIIKSVQFEIADSGENGKTAVQTSVLELAPGATGTLSGILTSLVGCASQGNICGSGSAATTLCYVGGNGGTAQVEQGSWPVTATVKGSDVNDENFTITRTGTIRWDCVNNCG